MSEKLFGGGGDLFDGRVEGGLVGPGGRPVTADFADELECRGSGFSGLVFWI